MSEKWLPVFGYEALYEISDLGRVRSIPRSVRAVSKAGRTYALPLRGRVLRQRIAPNGYANVALSNKGVVNTKFVHHMVLESFVGPRPADHEALHGDGNRQNNLLTNLRWGTRQENRADAVRHGTWLSGARHPKAVMTERDVAILRKMQRMFTAAEWALAFGVSGTTIRRICRWERYKEAA